MRKKKVYPPDIEAAWYVVKEFISPLLCSFQSGVGPIPYNTNEVLNHHFSGTRVFTPYWYGKSKYHLHLLQIEDHYYRSDHRATHSTGFHRADKIAQASVLGSVLGIATKKQQYDGYHVILCKIDIDGHHGESDCEQVARWLHTEHLSQSYWEPSTSFTGKHGYIKIAIRIGTPLEEVHHTLHRLFELLDTQRQILGYQAPIDVPCGLPSLVTWDDTIETPRNLPPVSYREYRTFCSLRRRMDELKITQQAEHEEPCNPKISDRLNYNDVLAIVQTPVPASITSSQCGKLPRFNRTFPDRPSLDDIRLFYELEYYEFSYFVDLLHTLENDPQIVSFTPLPSCPPSSVVLDRTDCSMIDIPIPKKYSFDGSVDSSAYPLSSCSSWDSDSPRTSADGELPSGHSILSPGQGKNVVSSSQTGNSNSSAYTYSIPTLRNYCPVTLGFRANNKDSLVQNNAENAPYDVPSQNANQRTGQYITTFLRDYYRAHHRVPTLDEIEEHVCAGYRQTYGTEQEDRYDRRRIISLLEKCLASFDPEKAAGRPQYERLMFIPYIKQVFQKSEYKTILADTSARKCRPKNVILDLFAGYCLTHLSMNRELTLSTYDGFQGFCANHGITVSQNMCLACRLLFEHYGWLEKLNANYEMPTYDYVGGRIVKQKGTAMAYTLTPQFPFYDQFERAVGKKNIEKVRTQGMVSMEDWENMEEAG